MKELSEILDDCLRRMAENSTSQKELLALYSEQAAELEPLLREAERFRGAREVHATAGFKRRSRAAVMAHARSHGPRRPAWLIQPAWQMSIGLAVVVIALMLSTVAFAQAALPGQPLYDWKIRSEQVWRAVSPDPVGVDLELAGRRTDELTDVVHDPVQAQQALDRLQEVLTRLQSEDNGNASPRIQQALQVHQQKLSEAGIQDPQLEALIHGKP